MNVRSDPYDLPPGFRWTTCDIDELRGFLCENYVEGGSFRLSYTDELLRWCLLPPGYVQDWHVGIRHGNKLVGFISAIPAEVTAILRCNAVEINFLCVDRTLRSKRMAPVLIMEITRRVNLRGIHQAVFTAGVVIREPVAVCQYYHRPIRPKKLIATGFMNLGRNMTLARTIKSYTLPKYAAHDLRPLEIQDCPAACRLLMDHLSKMGIYPNFTTETFMHWFLPRIGTVHCYVLGDSNNITDMCSFYALPLLSTRTGVIINSAYSWYNVSTSISMTHLITDSLILARDCGYDLFNSLDVQDNMEPIKHLKFLPGDGYLKYYLHGWPEVVQNILPGKVGLILP